MTANARNLAEPLRQRRQRPLSAGDPRQPTAKRQGLSRLDIAAALRAQDGLGLVGGEPLGAFYVVDHCHRCAALHGHRPERGCASCFRGLVCPKHNGALGVFGDDVDGLLRAARYVAHGRH
jgi:hypothetical protein